MTTPKLQMPELVVGQAGKELTHNQALAVLDQLAQAVVVDKDLTAPPGSPANGSMYIVAASATGAWSGQSGKLAYWLATVAAWTFITPADGWSVWVTDEAVRYERKAGAWAVSSGGSGMTNPMTTLGDLIYGGVSGTPSRLGAGAAGDILTIVGGLPAWGAPDIVSAYQSIAQTIPNNTIFTKINLDSELVDSGGAFDTSTSRFQPTKAGYYLVIGGIVYQHSTSEMGKLIVLSAYKNGVRVNNLGITGLSSNTSSGANGCCIVYLNGSTDYVELFTAQGASVAINLQALSATTFFQTMFLRA